MNSRKLIHSASFALLPMAGIASPLLALPAVTAHYGADAWAAIAIGQSIGMSLAIIVELGWGLTGPQRVARAAKIRRMEYLRDSIVTKTLVFIPLATLAGILASLLTSSFELEAGLVAVGSAAGGLSCSWFYIGVGSIAKIFWLDITPRIALVTASALLVNLGGGLWIYPVVGIICPAILAPTLVTIVEPLSSPRSKVSLRRTLQIIVLQRSMVGARTLSGIYISLPIAIVGLANPSAVALFAGIERLQRLFLQFLSAFPNSMQHWVGSAHSGDEKYKRAVFCIYINAAFGIFAGTIYWATAPYVAEFVFSGVIQITPAIAAASALLIFIVCTSRASGGIALVAARRVQGIVVSSLVGVLIGLPSIFFASRLYGSGGALAGEIFAELVVLCTQLYFLRRRN